MRVVRVQYHFEPEGAWADSPDFPGWSAAAESFEELRVLAHEGVIFLSGEDVIVEEIGLQQVWITSEDGSNLLYEGGAASGHVRVGVRITGTIHWADTQDDARGHRAVLA